MALEKKVINLLLLIKRGKKNKNGKRKGREWQERVGSKGREGRKCEKKKRTLKNPRKKTNKVKTKTPGLLDKYPGATPPPLRHTQEKDIPNQTSIPIPISPIPTFAPVPN